MVQPAPSPAIDRPYPFAPRAGAVHLASNESALGPSPRALAAARDAITARYPDPDATPLRRALAAHHGVDPAQVVVTNGSSEAIGLLVRAAPGHVVAPAGSFPLYARAARAAGRALTLAPRAPDHTVDLMALSAAIGPDTSLVFVASPDNPTGASCRGLADWLRSLPGSVVPVVDEAYAELTDAPDLRGAHPNLVTLRSFSKAYGLGSLRVGYALGPAPIVDALNRQRDPFVVNAPGQAAALAALDDTRWLKRARVHNTVGRRALMAGLRARGLKCLDSDANFVFVPDAGELVAAAAAGGVTVRCMEPWGFPGAARVTVGTDADHARLFDALDANLSRCAS